MAAGRFIYVLLCLSVKFPSLHGSPVSDNSRQNFGPLASTPAGRRTLGPQISPIEHVTAALPPIRIIHGDADMLVPLGQSRMLVAKAKTIAGAIPGKISATIIVDVQRCP